MKLPPPEAPSAPPPPGGRHQWPGKAGSTVALERATGFARATEMQHG
jgi:hypothetical protein